MGWMGWDSDGMKTQNITVSRYYDCSSTVCELGLVWIKSLNKSSLLPIEYNLFHLLPTYRIFGTLNLYIKLK